MGILLVAERLRLAHDVVHVGHCTCPHAHPHTPHVFALQITKQCQDVLTAVAVNCHNHSPEDVQVIEGLCGVRLKTKLFSSQFVGCMK